VGDYTDFYASIFHATNVGRLMRPDAPLLPNYKWLPVGYHGRASSIVPSGRPVRRPRGQRRTGEAELPVFAPTQMLDYELELAAWVGPGNELGTPVPLATAEEHVFGLTLLNDWSARDVQAWEYQPLGPFLAKSFATTVSPWIVTLEALAPFRAPAPKRGPNDPALLPHLADGLDRDRGGFEIAVEAWLHTSLMRARGIAPLQLSRGNAIALYWTFSQMIAHHTSNGCNLRPGDVLGSGTLSGGSAGTLGCLLEITRRGKVPLSLPSGETRAFLADGDEVILRGYCDRVGFRRIGLGECRGVVSPAADS
jgi:fumarylacetoacetase